MASNNLPTAARTTGVFPGMAWHVPQIRKPHPGSGFLKKDCFIFVEFLDVKDRFVIISVFVALEKILTDITAGWIRLNVTGLLG